MGVPLVIIHFRLGFSHIFPINHPAIGYPIYGNVQHFLRVFHPCDEAKTGRILGYHPAAETSPEPAWSKG